MLARFVAHSKNSDISATTSVELRISRGLQDTVISVTFSHRSHVKNLGRRAWRFISRDSPSGKIFFDANVELRSHREFQTIWNSDPSRNWYRISAQDWEHLSQETTSVGSDRSFMPLAHILIISCKIKPLRNPPCSWHESSFQHY